jgi:nucleotide-binding universal stress UspA family protein
MTTQPPAIGRRTINLATIVCAVRGGEASRATQDYAVRLARSRQARLLFFYTVDPAEVPPIHESEARGILEEMVWLGRVLLRMAQRRAERHGVSAEVVLGRGPLRTAVEELLRREPAELLIMGAPRHESTGALFAGEGVNDYAQSLEEATGVKVQIVRPDAGPLPPTAPG